MRAGPGIAAGIAGLLAEVFGKQNVATGPRCTGVGNLAEVGAEAYHWYMTLGNGTGYGHASRFVRDTRPTGRLLRITNGLTK